MALLAGIGPGSGTGLVALPVVGGVIVLLVLLAAGLRRAGRRRDRP